MANERPAESRWLYNQPTTGVVENWFRRNEARIRDNWIDPWILDGTFILQGCYEEYDGSPNIRYSQGEVLMTKDGPDVPKAGSELWHIWQKYTNSEEGKADFNGPKLHLHRYSPPRSDRELRLQTSHYDWHGMRVLGMGLRDGTVPEHYRDNILPVHRKEGFVFEGEHPNNTVIHGIIVTSDNELVLTTRAVSADYYAGAVSASFEEQMHGERDNSPHDTFLRAVATSPKLKLRGEELRLHIPSESVRLAAIGLEPDINAVVFIMLGRCDEQSSEIDVTKFGTDRAEFNPNQPIWTMSLQAPEQLIKEFFTPERFIWHGTSRARIVAALSYVHGYEEALDRLYKATK